jgi:hypothetical protein
MTLSHLYADGPKAMALLCHNEQFGQIAWYIATHIIVEALVITMVTSILSCPFCQVQQKHTICLEAHIVYGDMFY